MGFLYLVAFKGQPYGHEDDFNYALRELLDEHCSYCIPAGKTEVWGPYAPNQSLVEINWLTQEMSFTSLDYSELINSLRAAYKKIHGYEPPRWSKYFEDNNEERLARRRRQQIWRREKGWLFQKLIKKWTAKLRRARPLPPEDDQ